MQRYQHTGRYGPDSSVVRLSIRQLLRGGQQSRGDDHQSSCLGVRGHTVEARERFNFSAPGVPTFRQRTAKDSFAPEHKSNGSGLDAALHQFGAVVTHQLLGLQLHQPEPQFLSLEILPLMADDKIRFS